ncbi:thioredoxin family protein [Candidatus Gottesmanbacteria bacterium]|nr:thioredoxin family protein [Candidatus Gottesmanbacteria bacterium]
MSKLLLIPVVVIFIVGAVIFTVGKKEKPSILQSTPQNETEKDMQAPSRVQNQYVEYSKTVFDAAAGKKRIYFFHAKWCPTCKATNEEFLQNSEKIPNDIIIFKTDYDTERDLKKKYGITYQHTFVQVDEVGNELTKWNGGGIDTLIANVQ